jgi:transcriptional regulator NrdR family protein
VEDKIQKIVKNTGYTRNEVIQGLVLAFFDKRDVPKENISAFVLMVKRALRELESGG